jgi:hypothetical protein
MNRDKMHFLRSRLIKQRVIVKALNTHTPESATLADAIDVLAEIVDALLVDVVVVHSEEQGKP